MLLDLNFWPISILVAALATGIFALYCRNAKEFAFSPKKAAVAIFIGVLLVARFGLYYFMPSFQGVLGGYWWLGVLASVPSTAAGILITGGASLRKLAIGVGVPAFLFVVVPIGQVAWFTWGPYNAMHYGELASIRIARDGEKVPPTDPNKMVLVSEDIAVFKGQTALTSTSQNLGSQYKIDPDGYVLQSVNGHRYWIAPLIFANQSEDFWQPLFWGNPSTPGYVVVDAQDPNRDATVRLDFKITLFSDGSFAQNVQRFLYQNGFDSGDIAETKFEVDDNWHPHWVVSYTQNTFGGVGGAKIAKVAVIDVSAETPKLTTYNLGEEPDWVERVNPEDMISKYVTDYGMYNNDYARAHPWQVYFNFRRDGSLQPSEFDLNYTNDSHSVYVIPMTSVKGSDHAVAGLIVYDTRKNSAVLYPDVRGFNTGNTVKESILHAPVFLGKNLDVDQVQLYSIYGELTWVAVITNPQATGKGFAGVALLHAHSQNSADVIFASDMNRALGQYASQIARKHNGTNPIAQQSETKSLSGKLIGFGIVPGSMQQPNVWTLLVEGDSHVFTVTRDTYSKIAMLHEGDVVSISYLNLDGGSELAVSQITCPRLDGTSAAPSAK